MVAIDHQQGYFGNPNHHDCLLIQWQRLAVRWHLNPGPSLMHRELQIESTRFRTRNIVSDTNIDVVRCNWIK
ncbi:hypothetical protein RRSWK_02376 [Rhodopirellula sp. SWK7]|nr:hypothetical protein RRSWK_02376 [Rhodopirellula sp. SWK7]